MDFEQGQEVASLRATLRSLVGEVLPASFHGAFTHDPADLALAQEFCRRLAEEHLLCPAWPSDVGGKDASVWEQTAMREEMWAAHEPRGAQYMGVNWVGPTLLLHGTEDQQALHLPPIAAGQVIWCQGFSEPDSGSDLASLSTTATRIDGGWQIDGQKIWTSYATMAQWCFLLARSTSETRRQAGLSVFLVPMTTPGIEVRPIASMIGPHHLNEVFFDGVLVDDGALLGSEGNGWSIVQDVLSLERVGIARYARVDRLSSWAPHALAERWEDVPEALRARWVRLGVRTRRARLLAYRVVERQGAGTLSPVDAAAYRIAVTALDQEAAGVLVELAAFAPVTEEARRFVSAAEDHARYAMASTVASGTTEVQRILLARSLVGRR
jgi:alkylation response protein AidB-like acyl-CoA dehydrogenase